MKLNRKCNLLGRGLSRRRYGTSSVEFAIVCPMVFAIIFGMLEISRLSTVIDTARTSVIAGARQARVVSATGASIKEEMERTLGLFGIRESTIEVMPAVIDSSVSEVSIRIDVPLNAANGLYLITLTHSSSVKLDIAIER